MVGVLPASDTGTIIDVYPDAVGARPSRRIAALPWETPQVVQPSEQVLGTADERPPALYPEGDVPLRVTAADKPEAGIRPGAGVPS